MQAIAQRFDSAGAVLIVKQKTLFVVFWWWSGGFGWARMTGCGIGGRGCVSCTISYVYLILLQYSTWGFHSSYMIMVSDIHITVIIFLGSGFAYDWIEWLASDSGFLQNLYSVFHIEQWKYFVIYCCMFRNWVYRI